MKSTIAVYLLLISTFIFSETINHNPDPNGDPWISGGWKTPSKEQMEIIDSYTELELTQASKNKKLPYEINNSYSIYFRPIFTQYANECGQAAGIGYNFTYELNYMRGNNANFNQNQYPTHFTYNFLNDGDGINGSSYFDGWDIAMRNGIPYNLDYGGMTPSDDRDSMNFLWMSDFEKYERTMENRVQEVLTINVGSPEGLNDLKHWFYDHGDGSDEGGIITFAAGVFGDWQTDVLPIGTENENQMVVTKWHTSVNHAMTFVGYNDSIRYDYNGDGKYTNDIDITDDGIIDMRDWEIGALLMVNSWGTGWGYFGRAWVMYNTLGYHHVEGGIWAQRTNTIKVFESYEPLLKINTEIDYNLRDKIKIYAGISTDTNSVKPEHTIEFLAFDHSGGTYPMSGDSTFISIGLDITPLLVHMESDSYAKFFLCIDEDDVEGTGSGNILSMSLIDKYGNQTLCPLDSVNILNNDTTYVSSTVQMYYYTPNITTTSLPDIDPNEFYSYQLTARGAPEPFQWDNLIDYTEIENSDPLPDETFTELVPEHNYDNDIFPLALDFEFPFYGVHYDSIFVCTDGYLSFLEKYDYIRDESDIIENKVIASHAAEFMGDPALNEGTFYSMDTEHITIYWNTAYRMDLDAKCKFYCKLYKDGKIEFFHSDGQSTDFEWVSGMSNGRSDNYMISSISNAIDPSNLKIKFLHPDHPFGLILDDYGSLSGTLINKNENYWNLKFKITDWNGLSSINILPLSTTTGINTENTINDNILLSNYPNPFNPSTNINFSLLENDKITLMIYNIKGEIVETLIDNKLISKGTHSLLWNPSKTYSSGLYFYGIRSSNGLKQIKKMTILK